MLVGEASSISRCNARLRDVLAGKISPAAFGDFVHLECHYYGAGDAEPVRQLAKRFAGKIRDIDSLCRFVSPRSSRSKGNTVWALTANDAIVAFLKGDGVESSSALIRLAGMLQDPEDDDELFAVEAALVRAAMSLCSSRDDVFEFARRLKSVKGMLLYTAVRSAPAPACAG